MVQIGFYTLSGFMFLSILYMLKQIATADQVDKNKAANTFLIWAVIWLIYVSLISAFDVLHNFEMPPRVPLVLVVPVMISIILFNRTEYFGKRILPSITPTFAIYIQSFRIVVELLIYGAYLNMALPREVTFEGTNFDILVGFSAPVIGLLYSKKVLSNRVVLAWNFVSLSVLGFTVYTFISRYYFSGPIEESFKQFGNMPYILLPAFLLPCAIFFHIISIRQMIR